MARATRAGGAVIGGRRGEAAFAMAATRVGIEYLDADGMVYCVLGRGWPIISNGTIQLLPSSLAASWLWPPVQLDKTEDKAWERGRREIQPRRARAAQHSTCQGYPSPWARSRV